MAAISLAVSGAGIIAGPAHAAAVPRIDLKVLVIDDGDSAVTVLTDRMKAEGVPMTVVDVRSTTRPQIDAAFLAGTDTGGAYAKYAGVITPDDPMTRLSSAEVTALTTFEKAWGIRHVVANTYPRPSAGQSYAQWEGFVDGMTATVTPAGKALGWGYLRGPVDLDNVKPTSGESYGFLATPVSPMPAGTSFTPVLTAPMPGTGVIGTMVGVHQADGRERLIMGFYGGYWLSQSQVLSHGVITWVTRGLSTSLHRTWLSVHSDDVLLPGNRWSMKGNCTIGVDCDRVAYPSTLEQKITMTAADVATLVAWQQRNGIKIDQAFNGAGAISHQEHYGQPDPVLAALRANASRLRFLNHTYAHDYLGCVQNFATTPWTCRTTNGQIEWPSLASVTDQIQKNTEFAAANGLPLNPAELVTGQHSGLPVAQVKQDNPNLVAAVNKLGVTWIASDNALEPEQRAFGKALTVPRHSLAITYNVGTEAEQVDMYNWNNTSVADGGSGACQATNRCVAPLDIATGWQKVLRPQVARDLYLHMVSNDVRPHYVHQSNLAEDALLYDVMDDALAAYRRTFASTTTILNPSQAVAGQTMQYKRLWAATTTVTARLEGRTITLANTGGGTVRVPLTVPAATTRSDGAAVGSLYAGQRSAWVTMRPRSSQSFTLGTDSGFRAP